MEKEIKTQATCHVCGLNHWLDLPDPTPGRSVTTAGRIIDESLGKAQCIGCGFVQRIHAQFLGLADYYEQDYARYYDRPGTAHFHAARYRVFAEWMRSVLKLRTPSTILDVGCGQGWTMEAMKALYPQARLEGLEPSHHNSEVARQKGFPVHTCRVSDAAMPQGPYDLVYSNNVLQHTASARSFITSLKAMIGQDGVIVITCPDGSIPNIEILWADQNFSFLPEHLICLCQDIGFGTISWFASPSSASVPPAQMLFLSKTPAAHKSTDVPPANRNEIYQSRCNYLTSFRKIDDHISSRAENCERVFNFGASYWSSVLAAYCPAYWQQVSACLVDYTDHFENGFLDKAVLPLNSIQPTDTDAIVLGTSPRTHHTLNEKLVPSWQQVISWDNFAVQC